MAREGTAAYSARYCRTFPPRAAPLSQPAACRLSVIRCPPPRVLRSWRCPTHTPKEVQFFVTISGTFFAFSRGEPIIAGVASRDDEDILNRVWSLKLRHHRGPRRLPNRIDSMATTPRPCSQGRFTMAMARSLPDRRRLGTFEATPPHSLILSARSPSVHLIANRAAQAISALVILVRVLSCTG